MWIFYDVEGTARGSPWLKNKRSVFESSEGAPDGIKIVTSALQIGVNVIDPEGGLAARIQTKHVVEKISWTSKDPKTMYLVGIGGITKVDFALQRPGLSNCLTR